MGYELKGEPPYELPAAQAAGATAVDEVVELTLRVILPGIEPSPAAIRVRMTAKIADGLSVQIQEAVLAAVANAGKG